MNLKGISCYDGIVQLIEAQTQDPVTGLVRGEKAQALNTMQPSPAEVPDDEKELVHHLDGTGTDPTAECGLYTLADPKGKGP